MGEGGFIYLCARGVLVQGRRTNNSVRQRPHAGSRNHKEKRRGDFDRLYRQGKGRGKPGNKRCSSTCCHCTSHRRQLLQLKEGPKTVLHVQGIGAANGEKKTRQFLYIRRR